MSNFEDLNWHQIGAGVAAVLAVLGTLFRKLLRSRELDTLAARVDELHEQQHEMHKMLLVLTAGKDAEIQGLKDRLTLLERPEHED